MQFAKNKHAKFLKSDNNTCGEVVILVIISPAGKTDRRYIWKVNNCYDLRWEEEDEEEEVIWRLPSWGMRSGHGHRSPSKPCSQIQPLQQKPPARPLCTTSPTATWPSPSFWRLHPQPPSTPAMSSSGVAAVPGAVCVSAAQASVRSTMASVDRGPEARPDTGMQV